MTSNGTEILSLDYDYDGLGRVTGIDQALSGAPTAYAYGYDSLGQLTSASVNGVERTYGYDANGNRVVGRGINLTGNELFHNGDDQKTGWVAPDGRRVLIVDDHTAPFANEELIVGHKSWRPRRGVKWFGYLLTGKRLATDGEFVWLD